MDETLSSQLSSMGEFEQSAAQPKMSPALEKARSVGIQNTVGEFTTADARGIYIRGYGVTSAQDKQPVIGTNGMVPCIAVALYNPAKKIGAIAHFDTNTDTQSLKDLIQKVGGDDGAFEAHIVGGDLTMPHSRRLAEEVVGVLTDNPNATIKSADLLNPAGGQRSLALDTRTGETFNQFSGMQLDKGTIRAEVTSFHASTAASVLPLRPEYVHGKEFKQADWLAELQQPAAKQPELAR